MSAELAAQTRAIKKLLEAEYGKGKVSVTATHRGTAFGWIRVVIKTPPSDEPWRLYEQVLAKLRAASIDLDYYQSDFGHGVPMITITYGDRLQMTAPASSLSSEP